LPYHGFVTPSPSSGRRLVALPARLDGWLVEQIVRAWEAGEAVSVVDASSPLARARLDALGAHVWRTPDGDLPLEPGAPPVPEDAWIVQVTSGTTGTPRAVVLSEANVRASASAVAERLSIGPGDRWATALSPAFVGGLATIARSIVIGTPITLMARHRPEDLEAALAEGATLATTVHAALVHLDVTPLRAVIIGAGPATGALPANAITSYGMTETGSGIVYNGRALPGVELDVRESRIFVRGPMVAERLRTGVRILDGEGWLETGDVGVLEDDRLVVWGRAEDLITSGGVHVAPAAVEAAAWDALRGRVHDLVVWGTPDDRFGQVVTLGVVGDSPSPAELRALLDGRLDAAWIPRRVVALPRVPRTETGKPLRRLLPGADPRRASGPRERLRR